MGYIIDISSYQEPSKINYDVLSKELDHVIIRSQYGSRLVDKAFKTHHREFRKRGIPTSAYAWVRGISIADMKKEAEDFYSRTKEFQPVFWFLDVEERSMKDIRSGVSAYVKRLRELGAKNIGIYIGHHLYPFFNLNLKEVDAVWIPHYGRNTGKVDSKPAYPCDIHQYTSKGQLKGYNGYLDLNRLMGGFSFEGKREESEKIYIVKPGDTLWALSRRFGVSIDELVAWNNIKNRDLILVGQKLRLEAAIEPSTSKIIYKVKKGDTLSHIALKYGIKVEDIVKANNIKNPDLIYIGDLLIIPKK